MSPWVLILFLTAATNPHSGAVAIDMYSEASCRKAYQELLDAKPRPNLWGYCMKRSP